VANILGKEQKAMSGWKMCSTFFATKVHVQVTDFSYPLSMHVTNCCGVCLSMFVFYRPKFYSLTQFVFPQTVFNYAFIGLFTSV